MSLPTVYPGFLIPTSGDLTILPRYASVDEVLLKSEQVVLSVASAYDDTPVSLLDGDPHTIAVVSLPAPPIDSIVTFSGIATIQLDGASGVSVYGSINGVVTPTIGNFLPSSLSTDGNPITIPFHGQSGNILAGTPISATVRIQMLVPSDVTVLSTSISAMTYPTPLLV